MIFNFDFSQTETGLAVPCVAPLQTEGLPQSGSVALSLPKERILIDAGESESGWHRLEAFLRCPQFYSYRYNLGMDLGDNEALVKGSLVHVGLAHYYARRGAGQRLRGEPPGVLWYEEAPSGSPGKRSWQFSEKRISDSEAFYEPHEAMDIVARRWAGSGERETIAKVLPTAHEMIDAYVVAWKGSSADMINIVAVEQVVRFDVMGWLLTARIDLVVSTRHGIVYWDHKSSSDPTSWSTVARYTLSGQVHVLHQIGKSLHGDQFKGLLLNIVGSRPPYKMRREAPPPAPAMRDRIAQVVADANAGIKALERSGRDPWEWPRAANEHTCVGPYGPCHAWKLCARGKSIGALDT